MEANGRQLDAVQLSIGTHISDLIDTSDLVLPDTSALRSFDLVLLDTSALVRESP